jgi:NADH dehydrogenase/NADH:ubiquinone oxidoreductase subunit G
MSDKDKKPERVNGIKNRTLIHKVTDLDLASALLAVGVPLRKDPPYTAARMLNGHIAWVFNFEARTSDGKHETAKLIEAYVKDAEYIVANPEGLYTGAICALKNRSRLLEHMRKVKPWVGFQSPKGQSVILCIEGSKKHANYVARGWKRCNPVEDRNA